MRIWRRLAGHFMYLPYIYSGNEWDRQYAAGRWDFLSTTKELAHQSVIAGYIRSCGGELSILDAGCGSGTLQQMVGEANYQIYLGIDISAEAIARTRDMHSAKTSFQCADIANFVPAQSYRVMVFNECLYYLADPVGVLRRYAEHLEDGGVFIVSMYVETQTRRIWNMLDHEFDADDAVHIAHQSGSAWIVKVLRSRQKPPVNLLH